MWDRKEIKAKGKEAYRKNRLMCIIAALLLALTLGGGSIFSTGTTTFRSLNDNKQDVVQEDASSDATENDSDTSFQDIKDQLSTELTEEDIAEGITQQDKEADNVFLFLILGMIGVFLLIVIAIGTVFDAFILNPLQVGIRKFFTENATNSEASLGKNNLGLAFNENYMNIVGAMFLTKFLTTLGAIFFIIPGIYLSLKWRMVPFLLGENPKMTGAEARARSAEMMDGNKWKAFVLDLSFFGWIFLGCLTFGILNLVFTEPYQAATDSELYLALDGRPTPPLMLGEPPIQEDPEEEITAVE